MDITRRNICTAALLRPTESGIKLVGACLLPAAGASAQTALANILAPSGTLRVAINFGHPVLAQRDPATGEPRGVSTALAIELGRRLGMPVRFVEYTSAGQVTDAGRQGAWHVCVLAVDPVRSQGILFTAPYVLIKGIYLVLISSRLETIEDVDRSGHRVAVGRGSAYDLHLSRALRHAELVRATTSPAAVEIFRQERLDAVAGVKQPLLAYASANSETRVIPGRFMVIMQAVGVPQGLDAALPWLRSFVEEMKASGFVARALAASDQSEAEVAPAAG